LSVSYCNRFFRRLLMFSIQLNIEH
jgi:hypothetical protein